MQVAGAVALLAHLFLLAGVVLTPLLRHPVAKLETPDEIAQFELVIGNGAQETGTPPPAAETEQEAVQQTAPPPVAAPPPQLASPLPADIGLPAPPPLPATPGPPPPAQAMTPVKAPAGPESPPQQAKPTDAAAKVQPSYASIRLGDGLVAPPVENPLDFVGAGPDARNMAPEYPPEAARRRELGVVRLELQIDVQGRVTEVLVVQSSGSPRLDEAARKQLLTWHFRPAFKDGRAVPSVFPQTIEFAY
jgi:protein TonB